MESLREFYACQNEWARAYLGGVSAEHRQRAGELEGLFHDRVRRRILELGSGGGQMAVALAERGHQVTGIERDAGSVANARTLAAALAGAPADTTSEELPLCRHGGRRETPVSRIAQGPSCSGRVAFLEGDFYTVEPPGPFDLVLYLDGFGIGSDDDQRRLLRRAAGWTTPAGQALIEIYAPWFWAAMAGNRLVIEQAEREYGFDPRGCRMLDTWWHRHQPGRRVTQSLRCYSPADLDLLLEGTGWRLTDVVPGGAVDLPNHVYHRRVPLARAMQYLACLERT